MIKKLLGLWAAIRRQTIQQDIDSELAYHVEMRTRALEATGMGVGLGPSIYPRWLQWPSLSARWRLPPATCRLAGRATSIPCRRYEVNN